MGVSRQEIHVLRRQRGDVLLLPEDFKDTAHLLPVDRTNLALAHARARTRESFSEELVQIGRQLLRPEEDSFV
jgi:hypothetical protein